MIGSSRSGWKSEDGGIGVRTDGEEAELRAALGVKRVGAGLGFFFVGGAVLVGVDGRCEGLGPVDLLPNIGETIGV